MAKGLKHKGASTVVWGLMALLILGLGGFGVTNFSGNVRSIGSVGDREIPVGDYARALEQELRAVSAEIGQPVPFPQAQTLGVDRTVRAQIVAAAALDNENDRIGVSVGDEAVRRQILKIEAFKSPSGEFDREAYAFALRQSGLGEAEFEAKLRDESARALLQQAVVDGVAAPAGYADTLYAWLGEERGFGYIALGAADLADPEAQPSEADLNDYYNAHLDAYTLPETRAITYAWLSPEMLADKVEVDEEALKAAYEQRRDEYVQPERRMVERLVFPDETTAATAKARFDAGGVSFEQLAAERGLTLEDIDLGEVAEADLGAAGPEVFALEGPGVVGPLPSDLGPALYAMNAILLAQETTFEEARADLSDEVVLDRARRMILDEEQNLEDLLAGGATLEDMAKETDMEIGQIDYRDGVSDGIAAYEGFRNAAAEAQTGAYPELEELDDGSVFALRLDEIRPPAPEPFDAVRDRVLADWQAAETTRAITALAEEMRTRLDGGTDIAGLGYIAGRVERIGRRGFVEGAPQSLVETVFAMTPGESRVIAEGETVWLVQLDTDPPVRGDGGAEGAAMRASIEAQTARSLAQDLFDGYVGALENEAGVRLNQTAIDAVHAQMR